jgi:hypothetical protein
MMPNKSLEPTAAPLSGLARLPFRAAGSHFAPPVHPAVAQLLSVRPKYQTIDLGFSTADGERPELQFVGGDIQFFIC